MAEQGSIESNANGPAEPAADRSPDNSASDGRWLASLSYLSLLALIPYFLHAGRRFVAFHAKQGLVLCALEALCGLLLLLFDLSLGRIPFLGLVLSLALRLVIFLPLLGLAVLGFARALSGESLRLPWIGEMDVHIPDPPVLRRAHGGNHADGA